MFDIWEGLPPIDATKKKRLFEASSAQAKKKVLATGAETP